MKMFWHVVKTNILAGVLVILPAGATLWLVMTLWTLLDKPIARFFLLFKHPESLGDGWQDRTIAWLLGRGLDLSPMADVPGLGLVLTLAIIFFLGLAARSIMGRTFISLGEGLVRRLPIVGSVYAALKQMLEAIFSENSKAFRHAVLIEFPREGVWSIAFMSNPVPPRIAGEVPLTDPEARDLVFCFIPTTPNPTSGWLVAVRRSQMHPLPVTVEEAIKIIISGGIFCGTPAEAVAAATTHPTLTPRV